MRKHFSMIYSDDFYLRNLILILVCGKNIFRIGILSDTIYRYRISDDLHWSSARIFQPEYYGDGSQDAFPASYHLPGDLFQHCAYNQCDGKYADGYSVSGWNVPVWYCTQSDPCSLWTVILAYLLLRISVWWISYASALCISGNVDS